MFLPRWKPSHFGRQKVDVSGTLGVQLSLCHTNSMIQNQQTQLSLFNETDTAEKAQTGDSFENSLVILELSLQLLV